MSVTVLVCAPAVRTRSQQATYEQLLSSLESRGFSVTVLTRPAYVADPWEELVRLMNRADGVVVAGFRQMSIRHGVWRDDTAEQATVDTVWTSPWMQIEAGMAIALGKPVLVLPERGVSEGIFARQNWTATVFGSPAGLDESPEADRWAATVRALAKRRPCPSG